MINRFLLMRLRGQTVFNGFSLTTGRVHFHTNGIWRATGLLSTLLGVNKRFQLRRLTRPRSVFMTVKRHTLIVRRTRTNRLLIVRLNWIKSGVSRTNGTFNLRVRPYHINDTRLVRRF